MAEVRRGERITVARTTSMTSKGQRKLGRTATTRKETHQTFTNGSQAPFTSDPEPPSRANERAQNDIGCAHAPGLDGSSLVPILPLATRCCRDPSCMAALCSRHARRFVDWCHSGTCDKENRRPSQILEPSVSETSPGLSVHFYTTSKRY